MRGSPPVDDSTGSNLSREILFGWKNRVMIGENDESEKHDRKKCAASFWLISGAVI